MALPRFGLRFTDLMSRAQSRDFSMSLKPSRALLQRLLLTVALDDAALVFGKGEKLQSAPAGPVTRNYVAHDGVYPDGLYCHRNVKLDCDQIAGVQRFQASTASANPAF